MNGRLNDLALPVSVGAMMITGMQGLVIGHVAISGVLIHLTILLAASAGGLPFATTIAMIIAAIVGLSELSFTGMIAVYGMTGFFAGALRKFGKLGIAVGAGAVSLFFFMYDLTLPLDKTYFTAIGLATFIFFLIPSKKLEPLRQIFFPASGEDEKKQQKWLAERLDEQLNDFQQFAEFMSSLVGGKVWKVSLHAEKQQIITPSVCQSCFRYSKCWESEDDDMSRLIYEWETTYSMTKKSARIRVEQKIKYKCIKFTGLDGRNRRTGANRLLSGQLQHGGKCLRCNYGI